MAQRRISCKGRFPDLRDELSSALEIVVDASSTDKIKDVFDLVVSSPGLYNFDAPDNYFLPSTDDLRAHPSFDYSSIIPLISRKTKLPRNSAELYLAGIVGNTANFKFLDKFNQKINLVDRLGMTCPPKYFLCSNFGIGNLADDVVVSDSPFTIELWTQAPETAKRLHTGTVGFWYQKKDDVDSIIVDQIQSARTGITAHIEGKFALRIACDFADKVGINEVRTYSAQKHPMFKRHPERKAHLLEIFTALYDKSAIACGFEGDKQTGYLKRITK